MSHTDKIQEEIGGGPHPADKKIPKRNLHFWKMQLGKAGDLLPTPASKFVSQ